MDHRRLRRLCIFFSEHLEMRHFSLKRNDGLVRLIYTKTSLLWTKDGAGAEYKTTSLEALAIIQVRDNHSLKLR